MNASPRRPGTRRAGQAGMRARRAATAGGALLAAAVLVAGCAHFPDAAPTFSDQPSLQPTVATVVTSPPAELGASTPTSSPKPDSPKPNSPKSGSPSSGPPPSGSPSSPQTGASTAADPCGPSQPPVVATCLDAPWGLAPLPDGTSALVGERTTGKILLVAPGKKPEVVATITGLDSAGGGGLLGIALSPFYPEDNLIYAYVSTPKDNRILRLAVGEQPKAIFTGIPHGSKHNGGPIAFGDDNLLYVATGDAGDPHTADDPASLAGKVLRLDAFGKPAGRQSTTGTAGPTSTLGTPAATPSTATTSTGTSSTGTSSTATTSTAGGRHSDNPAVFASGFTDPTGICPLPGGGIGVLDHRDTADLLIPVHQGRTYSAPKSGDTLWVYQPGDGGGVDCAVAGGNLLATSLDAERITSIQMTPSGGFTGSPQGLATKVYGRLRTVVAGPGPMVWLTTSNKDGHGKPVPSDDRVIVLPPESGGGGGGGVD